MKDDFLRMRIATATKEKLREMAEQDQRSLTAMLELIIDKEYKRFKENRG